MKINQVWEWDIDRTNILTFKVNDIKCTEHIQKVVCEILDGPDKGTCFTTDAGNFNNNNWRYIKQIK